MSEATGGRYFRAKDAEALSRIFQQIDELERTPVETVRYTQHAELARPLLLAGFSQGACLSIEYVCAGLPAPDALAAFTGCRVGVPGDARSDAAPAGMPVYLSGSDADPWIPVSAFADAAQSLGIKGARLRADLFPGRNHEVSDAEIAMLDDILGDLSAGRGPRMGAAR